MTFNYVTPLYLSADLIFNTRKVYMRYGQIVGCTVTNNNQLYSSFVNLIVKNFNQNKYSQHSKIYNLTLSQFQQITFRYDFPELYLFQEIHEDGNENDFDALPDITALTDEYARSSNIDLIWIEPNDAPYWTLTETTIPELLEIQFKIASLPTVTNSIGTFNAGTIESALDSGLHKVRFEMDSEEISKGVYYIGVSVNPSMKVKYKFNNAVSYSDATYLGIKSTYRIFQISTLEDAFLEILIQNSTAFNIVIYNRNPFIDYGI